ncbi:MAG: CinA family protein [Rickettsiales bacterium]
MFSLTLIDQASTLIEKARQKQCLIVTAESCTGGLFSALLTEVPGSSDVFQAGWITYANEAKIQLLGVDAELINAHGAVSEEVARAMAQGAAESVDPISGQKNYAVSVTGIG